MKVLIRARHKEHLRPRAHIWIGGDTLCQRISSKAIKASKYMLIEKTPDLLMCQNCLQQEAKIWKFIENGNYASLQTQSEPKGND